MKPDPNTPPARRLVSALLFAFLLIIASTTLTGFIGAQGPEAATFRSPAPQVFYRSTTISELEIFYREAGSRENPTILLLHGFPTSSHMFRNLIPALADGYHVVAPDYPGFGYSSMPTVDEFDYTFDRLAEIVEALLDTLDLDSYSIYLMDYGAW